jgi:tRNA(Ile)-lysidine synthase
VALDDLSMIEGSVADTLSIKKLLSLTPDRQRQVLRFWLRQLNFPVPSAIKLQQIQQDMLLASIDKVPHVAWKTVELRRFRDNIYAMTRLPLHDSSQCVEWDLQTSLLLPGINALHAKKIRGQGIFIESEKVTVRFRQGGEICQLPGRDCHHHLKNLLQTWHIPTWLRDRIPLIFVNDKLAAAVGLFIDQKFLATAEQEGYVIAEK